MSKKKWIKVSEDVTIELSGIRSIVNGESTYLYVKYVGERKPTGYPMGSKQGQRDAYSKLSDALIEFNAEVNSK